MKTFLLVLYVLNQNPIIYEYTDKETCLKAAQEAVSRRLNYSGMRWVCYPTQSGVF